MKYSKRSQEAVQEIKDRATMEAEDKFFAGFPPFKASMRPFGPETHSHEGYQLLTVRITRKEFLKLPMAARRRILSEADVALQKTRCQHGVPDTEPCRKCSLARSVAKAASQDW